MELKLNRVRTREYGTAPKMETRTPRRTRKACEGECHTRPAAGCFASEKNPQRNHSGASPLPAEPAPPGFGGVPFYPCIPASSIWASSSEATRVTSASSRMVKLFPVMVTDGAARSPLASAAVCTRSPWWRRAGKLS